MKQDNVKVYIGGKEVGTFPHRYNYRHLSKGKLIRDREETGTFSPCNINATMVPPPEETPRIIIPNSQEATLTFHAHINPLTYYEIFGIPMTNNYLKMHGGILQRKARKRKRRRKHNENITRNQKQR